MRHLANSGRSGLAAGIPEKRASAQRLIAAMLPNLRGLCRGLGIINLGTVGSTAPNARMLRAIMRPKGALWLIPLTIGLAKEVAGSNIRVNLVSPGMILTPEVEASYMRMAAQKDWGTTWAE